jgi:hypothetical protein
MSPAAAAISSDLGFLAAQAASGAADTQMRGQTRPLPSAVQPRRSRSGRLSSSTTVALSISHVRGQTGRANLEPLRTLHAP